jgi:hypothetical protein
MKKYIGTVLTGCLLLTCLIVSAQEPGLTKIIASRFSKIWYFAPQEKVYLQTDKSYYSAGENIWFSAYIVNAATHKPDTKSNYVYVELIDRADSVINRVKLKRDSLGIAGNIYLKPEMIAGEYVLRAYTYWMQNTDADFFFKKKIRIGNYIDDRIKMDYEFGKSENGKQPVKIIFTNTFSTPLDQKNIVVRQSWLPRNKNKLTALTSKKGEVQFVISVDSNTVRKRFLDITIAEPGVKFYRKVLIPESGNDFDIQFFPESGVFLDDNIQTVAFKAVARNGLATDIKGKLFNDKNEELTDFSSFSYGMGKFILKTSPNEKYYAVITNSAGITKKVDLPQTQSGGISLHLASNRGKTLFQLINQSKIPTDSLFLMIHSRGIVFLVLPFSQTEGQIPESFLPPGICSYAVIDSAGNTYCERLQFIRNLNFPVINMQSNKTLYGKREPVELTFNLENQSVKKWDGNFSLSITDSKLVEEDSINDNILSYLLLSSDIKGYIENPKQYFADNSPVTREKTDILMLTQGWRRFNTAGLVKGKSPKLDYYMEVGQTVSGKVLNLANKPSIGTEIILLSGYKNQISTTKTDSSGQFILDGIEFPDSTNIILKAKSKVKIVDVELIPDKDIFPKSKNNIPFSIENKEDKKEEYLSLSKEKYYNEGGMMVINLEEFTVDAETKKSSDSFYAGMADNTFDAEKINEFPGLMIMDLIAMFPGVQVNGDQISIRGSQGNPLFVIDGIETDRLEDVQYLNPGDIEDISLFKGANTAMFGSKGGNGVITITLKKGASLQSPTPPSLARVSPLGYQKPAEFYVPKYEVDSILRLPKSDLRTTVYWSPRLHPDANGQIITRFFTADKPHNYRVELEGITKSGEICRFKGVLRRE